MPGAGGIVAANYVYNQAEPNGLTVGAFSGTLHVMQLVNPPGIHYDMNKFIPVGGMQGMIYPLLIGLMRTDTPYTSVEAVVQAIKEGKGPPRMANTGRGTVSYTRAKLLESIVPGLEFKYVSGYSGATTTALAIRRKETDGCLFGAPASFRNLLGDLYKAGKVTILAFTDSPEVEGLPEFPGIPPIWKYAKTETDRIILNSLLYKPGRPFYLAPGTPKERVNILRTAFMKAGKDPELLKDAKKARRPVTPTPGEELSKFFKGFFAAPPEVKQFIKEVYK
jgi:tripartite-type tricarboxylate transporter receptor subunit TctC